MDQCNAKSWVNRTLLVLMAGDLLSVASNWFRASSCTAAQQQIIPSAWAEGAARSYDIRYFADTWRCPSSLIHVLFQQASPRSEANARPARPHRVRFLSCRHMAQKTAQLLSPTTQRNRQQQQHTTAASSAVELSAIIFPFYLAVSCDDFGAPSAGPMSDQLGAV